MQNLLLNPQPPSLPQRIFQHLVFWLLYWGFHIYMYGSYESEYKIWVVYESLSLPAKLIMVYINLYVLIPHFLIKKQYGQYAIGLLIGLFCTGFLRWAMMYYGLPHFVPHFAEKYDHMQLFSLPRILGGMTVVLYVVSLTMAIKLFKYWYANEKMARKLEKDKLEAELKSLKYEQVAHDLEQKKLEAELKFLKGQLHPHFLFNTLNNLYALTLKKSDKAPAIVLKLSGLVHYMLYECNEAEVPLDKEIESLHNYIALEKIRYGNRVEVSLDVRGASGGKRIAPMLLLPFVENSFKHGISDELKTGWVSIQLHIQEQQLSLKVENSKVTESFPKQDEGGGIGLQNVQRRLDLLYPNDHSLRIFDEEDSFLVVLKLQLNTEILSESEPQYLSSL